MSSLFSHSSPLCFGPLSLLFQKSTKYCLLFKASRHGIERLECLESETDKNPKIVTLENCVKITQEPTPANLIHIVTKTGSLSLNLATEEDLKQWLVALQSVAFKEKADQANTSSHSSSTAIEEDNDLYCSSYGDGVFVIQLIKTDASQRCNIPEKMYKLSLGATDLLLVTFEDEKKVVAKWPYRFIRKYGYRDGHFTFEAGRKCDTGEGNFSLDHASPQEIFRCMSTKMKSMKKMLHGDPSLNAEEAQLSVAVSSMEAGSRSPIPLFPTTPSSDFDINSASSAQLHHSFASVRGFLSSADSLSNVSTTSSSIPVLKHIPNKPPRKTLPETPSPSQQVKLPELPKRNAVVVVGPRDYESIEAITDAWKTLGIDEVRHTETNHHHIKDLIEARQQHQQQQQQTQNTKKESLLLDTKLRVGKKLVEIPDTDGGGGQGQDDSNDENNGDSENFEGSYDHLEYFRSNSKNSSAYKTVIPISPPPLSSAGSGTSQNNISLTQLTAAMQKSTPAANDDYEIIGTPPPPDTKICRKADDSHLGYGMIRRPMGLPLPLPPTQIMTGAQIAVKQSPSASEANKSLFLEMTNDVLLKNNSAILLSEATTTTTTTTIVDAAKRIEMLANGDLVEDVDDVLGHRKFNGLDYAIVSKPKRV